MDYIGWKQTVEILGKIGDICEKNNISYTLLFDSLLSQYYEEGSSNWLSTITIGILYPDYLKLIEIIENNINYGLNVLNINKSRDFNALYSQIYANNQVVLPDKRRKDEQYYKSFINVYPILYIANKKRDLIKKRKQMKYYIKCMSALAPVPFGEGFVRKYRNKQKQYWYKMRKTKEEEMISFWQSVFAEAVHPQKYVLIPCNDYQAGCMCLADTYLQTEKVRFGEREVLCIKERKKWLELRYSKTQKKRIMQRPLNMAIWAGPETLRRVQLVALEILLEFDRICKKNGISYILSAGTLLGAIRHKGFIPWDDDIDIFMLNEEWIKFEKIADKELDKQRFFLRTQFTDRDDNLVFGQIKRNNTVYAKNGRDEFDTHKGIAIDILPFYNSPRSIIVFKLQNKVCRFFKTMTWAHMGSISEKRFFHRIYYKLLARVSNKTSYRLYYKFANMIKKPNKYLSYLCVMRNPYHKGFNQRKFFENICEVEFEGYKFPAPKEYDEYLKYLYGEEYMRLPIPQQRINHHLPGRIELNDLYLFNEENGSKDEKSV